MLYFDYKVNLEGAINLIQVHPQLPILAIAIQSNNTHSVHLTNQLGEAIPGCNKLYVGNHEVTSLSWHPSQRMLLVGLNTGEINLWNGKSDFVNLSLLHLAPITLLKWSHLGGRLISTDKAGETVGWKLDSRGLPIEVFKCKFDDPLKFIEFCCKKPGIDMSNLAKMAVAGDEKALDMFSSWRPRTGYRPSFNVDNLAFYIATCNAKIYYVNENGIRTMVLVCETNIEQLLHHETKDILLIMTNDFLISQYTCNDNGNLNCLTKVKLNGVRHDSEFVWAGNDILAMTTTSMTIRFWNMLTGDTNVVTTDLTHTDNEKKFFTDVSYSRNTGVLCGCTNHGLIVFWKKLSHNTDEWEETTRCKIKGCCVGCSWGCSYLMVNTTDDVFVLQEHMLCAHHNMLTAVQISANEVMVYKKNETSQLNADLKIIGVAMSSEFIAIWSGKTVAVYQISDSSTFNVLGTFSCDCDSALIYERSLIILPSSNNQTNKISVYNFQGTVKQVLECDGQPIVMHINASFLVVAVLIGILQLWDLSRREAKPYGHAKDLMDVVENFGEVILARINCNGRKVAFTVANSNLIPLPKLYVWNIETDVTHVFQYENKTEREERFIVSHFWDTNEPNLLLCEAKSLEKHKSPKKYTNEKEKEFIPQFSKQNKKQSTSLLMWLYSSEESLVEQDVMSMDESYISLLSLSTPYCIVVKKSSSDKFPRMENILMNNFDGIETIDEETIRAILTFGFCLSTGDVDDAFKTIRNVNSHAVWTNLAKTCVKKKRLDVALICLGNMNDARGVNAIRSAFSEPELEAQVAVLAIHLGMLAEAETLYVACGRYDLLNKMYQCSNKWDIALSIARDKDRIHLENTYDQYAKYLESVNNITEAICMYEKANTHRKHLPRLLIQDPSSLERYVQSAKDPTLTKWWAQYVESTGDMNEAIKYYEEAKDYLSIVRILCFLKQTEKATEIANTCGNAAACYHIARYHENTGHVEKAVACYIKANAFSNAIRICKENGLEEQLWKVSLLAGNREKLEAARYFEDIDAYKSIMLYEKANNLHRALYLALKFDLSDAVQSISSKLNSNSDIELMEKCCNYFVEKEQFEDTVNLLALAQKLEEAVDLCVKHRINITEELAEKLTPSANDVNKVTILNKIAEYCFLQGDYHLATKKFTQAGNKVKAMKALLKSGDTEKIIFFANVSREKEIYIMAANYLQLLEWQTEPHILKHIVNFYTKAKANHLLANFYIACAQVEIDEFGNYEKSVSALNEASRCLSKDADQYRNLLEQITKKTSLVKRFLDIKRQFEKKGSEQAMTLCKQLLSTDLEPVRRGDVYSLMIEHSTKNNDWSLASQLAQDMKKALPNEKLAYYIPKGILSRLGLDDQIISEDDNVIQEEEIAEIEDHVIS